MVFKSIGEISADIVREMKREKEIKPARDSLKAPSRLHFKSSEMQLKAANANSRHLGNALRLHVRK